MTPEEHRAEAERLLSKVDHDFLTDGDFVTLAVAHAVLATIPAPVEVKMHCGCCEADWYPNPPASAAQRDWCHFCTHPVGQHHGKPMRDTWGRCFPEYRQEFNVLPCGCSLETKCQEFGAHAHLTCACCQTDWRPKSGLELQRNACSDCGHRGDAHRSLKWGKPPVVPEKVDGRLSDNPPY